MSRTVSARIPKEMHEELRERCNKAGCSINDFIVESIKYIFTGRSEFDFGDEECELEQSSSPVNETKQNHEGMTPVLHFHLDDGKLVQDETTWEEKPKK